MWCNELLNSQRLEESDHRCHLRESTKTPMHIGTEEEAMVKDRVGTLAWLRKRLEEADTDLTYRTPC
jgi:hypothetical protein